MSLNMYIGEVQAQTESMNAFCNATIQGMEEVIRSIDAFALDVTLKGKTYESAKTFFMQTYRQLAQGIIYLCEELIIQNNAFPADFQAEVATVDVVEQEIREQIRELEQMIAAIAAMDEQTPETAAMLQIYHAMKRKLEDKLERLYQFNYSSSENYRTAIQLASSIAKGLAEVQSGKGFQAVSGTFHTERLNMEWAKPIQVITEEKMRKAEEERIKDESLLDKFKDAVEDGVGALDQASEKFFHTLENTPILGQLYSFKKGMDEAAIDGLKGLVNTFLHPIDSFESAMYALSHPQETFNSVTQAIRDSWNQEVVNGDWNSRAKWFGNMSMQALFMVVGTKGVDKISKVSKFSKVDKPSKINKSVNFIQSIKNVLNPNKYRQFIDMLNYLLMPKNQLAFEGGNVVDSSSDSTTFKQAEEKLSTYQFNKGTDETNTSGKATQTLEAAREQQRMVIESVESGKVALKTTKRKGNYGEMKMDDFFESQTYTRISDDRVLTLDQKIVKGIDAVYENSSPPPKYVIAEAKYNTSKLGKTNDGKQMSEDWILGSERLDSTLSKEKADEIVTEMVLNPENVQRIVIQVMPDGTIVKKILEI